MEGEKLEREI